MSRPQFANVFAMTYNATSKSLIVDFGVQFPQFRPGQENGSTSECYEDVCCIAIPAETAKNLAELIKSVLADEANDG